MSCHLEIKMFTFGNLILHLSLKVKWLNSQVQYPNDSVWSISGVILSMTDHESIWGKQCFSFKIYPCFLTVEPSRVRTLFKHIRKPLYLFLLHRCYIKRRFWGSSVVFGYPEYPLFLLRLLIVYWCFNVFRPSMLNIRLFILVFLRPYRICGGIFQLQGCFAAYCMTCKLPFWCASIFSVVTQVSFAPCCLGSIMC